ncbi:hypothetical protein MRB53_034227 [Persea americana]|uniref:Uncharacterized protein n=1 Tax=Persea americana TaxID=3435 RepID=A0ACC2KY03_PERAE|nr:hypothetical protein MRB53_034227 [Persea americana]
MQKLGFPAMKSLERYRYSPGSAKPLPISSRSSDSVSYGSFANLKLTAEKLVKEQASVKTDLEMAHSKLKKSAEHIHMLELKILDMSNENVKLKAKQKEDTTLWNGLEFKLSSTKTMCDQLTETLQHLADQVKKAEEDKKFFENKLSMSSNAFDDLQLQMDVLSSKLQSAEESIANGKEELQELRNGKEELEKSFANERSVAHNLIREKDAVIKDLEATVEENGMNLQHLDARFQEVQHELNLKEDICQCLRATQENLEKEKVSLESSNADLAHKILSLEQEIRHLKDLVNDVVSKILILDEYSATVSNNVVQLSSAYDTCYGLVQQEKDLAAKNARCKLERLHDQVRHLTSEKDAFQSEVEGLKSKVTDLQRAQEFAMVQHAEECRLAEEKIRRLESEAETIISKKNELETLVTKSKENIQNLTEASNLTANQMQDLLMKNRRLESDNQDMQEKMQLTLQGKEEAKEDFQKEIEVRNQHVESLQNQVNQLEGTLEEKEHLHLQFKERVKQLEEQRAEIEEKLDTAKSTLAEARKQYDLMLEGKQRELTKHLKEISQRNDQAINDIHRKCEMEKLEIFNAEKEKTDKIIEEMERKCDEKIADNIEEARQHLLHVQKEHETLLNQIQQEHEKKESSLRLQHSQELERVQHQADNELRERATLMRKEHEVQMRSLRHQHEDECRKLQDELELQKAKEEKQRALLQLQWKVMGDKKHEDREVESKKEFSVSSIKMRDTGGGNEDQLALISPENEGKNINFPGAMRTPVAKLLKKIEKGNTGSIADIPKHSKKVTRHEYEVETSNGRTITKRRKTKSTVMFGDPAMHKKAKSFKTPNVRKSQKVMKGAHSRPSNIGDLFTEGSLNPYTDDPYAFD